MITSGENVVYVAEVYSRVASGDKQIDIVLNNWRQVIHGIGKLYYFVKLNFILVLRKKLESYLVASLA